MATYRTRMNSKQPYRESTELKIVAKIFEIFTQRLTVQTKMLCEQMVVENEAKEDPCSAENIGLRLIIYLKRK